jgi:hypothetical protein
MSNRTRSVDDWLSDGESPLSRLLVQARRLQRLEVRVQAMLDPGIAQQVRVAGLEQGTLTLLTPRAGLATRLKLESPALLRGLQQGGPERVSALKIRVAPLPAIVAQERRARELPATAREALERFAQDNGYGNLAEMLGETGKKDDEAG